MKISVTRIDDYLDYQKGLISLEELIKRMQKIRKPSVYMQYGTAFHEIIENPIKCYNAEQKIYIASNGIKFERQSMDKYLAFLPDYGLREIFGSKTFEINGKNIIVNGKADQLIGYNIIENKTTWKPIDCEQYYNKFQWRFYLAIFAGDFLSNSNVHYNIFQLNHSNNLINIVDYQYINFYSYPTLEQDLQIVLQDFIKFIEIQNLEKYFNY